MWTSREGWLSAVRTWAQSPGFAAARASARVSITAATLLAIAAVMAEHADHATGRHVAVTRATIAARVGCDVRTVTTAWRVLRVGRWAVEAQRGHGSPGTPAAGRRPSVYHLVPRKTPQAVHDFHLPPSGGSSSQPCVENYSPSAHTRAPEQEFPTPTRHRRRWRTTPRPLAVQRLAAELVARSHGLHRGHIGAVCDAITAAGVDAHTWPVRAIIDALNADMRARGWSWPDRIERPAAFLASRLRRLQWRPEGPPKSGGQAAARTEGAARADTDGRQPSPPPPVLNAAQRAPIAAAKATARQQLAAALTGAAPTVLGGGDNRADTGRPAAQTAPVCVCCHHGGAAARRRHRGLLWPHMCSPCWAAFLDAQVGPRGGVAAIGGAPHGRRSSN